MIAKKLSYQLSIYFLISAIILSGLILLIEYYYVRNLVFESNRYRLQFEVQETLDGLENSMENTSRFLKQLAHHFNQEGLQEDPCEFMALIFDGQPNTFAVGLVKSGTKNGLKQKSDISLIRSGDSFRSVSRRFFSGNEKMNDWIHQMSLSSLPEWSEPFYDADIRARAMIYAYPFDYLDHGFKLHATFFCLINLDGYLRDLNKQEMIKSGFAVLINEKNQIIYHPDSLQTGNNISSFNGLLGNRKVEISRIVENRESGHQLIPSIKAKINNSVVIYWPVRSNNWFIIMAIPENLFISELKRLIIFLIPLIFFAGSVLAAVTIYNSFRFVLPISSLANDSRKIVEEADFDFHNNQGSSKDLFDNSMSSTISPKQTRFPLNDIKALASNMEIIKDRLANYRESTIQSSVDMMEIEKELKLARDIEMRMVPTKFPLVPGRTDFDCFGHLIPAKIVGGDLFDLFLLDDKYLFISITDTVGKGIPAAMYSVMTRTFIRSIANPITRLGKMMESLNDALSLVHESDMFATVLLGKLDLQTGEFIYCNAGHPYPFIVRNDLREEPLAQSQGIPVGIKRNIAYSERKTFLASGDVLITYTDGVTEQNDEHGKLFGIERLIATVRHLHEFSAQDIVNRSIKSLLHFQGRAEVNDDVTLVAIKFFG